MKSKICEILKNNYIYFNQNVFVLLIFDINVAVCV